MSVAIDMRVNPFLVKVAAVMSAATFLLIGCTKPSPAGEETVKDKMSFLQNECVVFVGEEVAVPVSYQVFERGVYINAEYDFGTNPYGVKINSSAPEIASVTSGKIKGLKEGSPLRVSSPPIPVPHGDVLSMRPRKDSPATSAMVP